MALHETILGGVATIVMDNPPVNALGIGDTYGLAEMLDGYRRADDVRAVGPDSRGSGLLRRCGHQGDPGHGRP